MKFGKRVQEHPLVVLASVFATAFGIGTGLTAAKYQSDLSAQKNKFQSQLDSESRALAAIHRQVGKNSDYLDVSKIVVTSDDAASIGAGNHYYSADRFYAQSPDRAWRSQQTTELQLLEDLVGPGAKQALAASGVLASAQQFPLQLWRRNDPHRIETRGGTMTVYPQVFVQRVSKAALMKTIMAAGRAQHAGRDELAAFRAAFARDPLAFMFSGQLQLEEQFAGIFGSVLSSVQKKGGVVYARFDSTFTNATVDGVVRPQYFWSRELVLAETPRDLYVVKTSIPRAEPRSDTFAALTKWFASFHIVADTT